MCVNVRACPRVSARYSIICYRVKGNLQLGEGRIILAKNQMDTIFEEAMEGSKISAKVNFLEINEERINILIN